MESKFQKEKTTTIKPIIIVLYTVLIIAGLMGFGALYYNYKKDNEKTYINSPKVGDIYAMELKNGRFSTARIDKVNKDSIYVTYNDYEIDTSTKIDEIDIDRNYNLSKDVTTLKKIKELFNNGTIYEVTRK
jgi:hypothetical protein